MKIKHVNCPPEDSEFEGTEAIVGASFELNASEQQSADGLSYTGSEEESFGGGAAKRPYGQTTIRWKSASSLFPALSRVWTSIPFGLAAEVFVWA